MQLDVNIKVQLCNAQSQLLTDFVIENKLEVSNVPSVADVNKGCHGFYDNGPFIYKPATGDLEIFATDDVYTGFSGSQMLLEQRKGLNAATLKQLGFTKTGQLADIFWDSLNGKTFPYIKVTFSIISAVEKTYLAMIGKQVCFRKDNRQNRHYAYGARRDVALCLNSSSWTINRCHPDGKIISPLRTTETSFTTSTHSYSSLKSYI